MFTFNGNYDDKAQIEPFYDAYLAVYDEIRAAGRYPYNDSFKGRIAGLDAATSKDEDSAIYMLQTLRDIKAMNSDLEGWRALGAVDVVADELSASAKPTAFKALIAYGFYVGGTGLKVYENVRLRRVGHGLQVIEKGKRNGVWLSTSNLIGIPA